MKVIVLLIALANVALFMWELNKTPEHPGENSETPGYAALEQIVLVKELNGTEPASATLPQTEPIAENMGLESSTPSEGAQNAVAQLSDQDQAECYEAGPFFDSKSSEVWRKQLADAHAEVAFVSRQGQAVRDYQVYYPAGGSLEQSRNNLQMIRNKGYKDAWLLTEGDENGEISLGVFKQEATAQTMKKQLQDQGIEAEVKPRYKNQTEKFILFKGKNQTQASLNALEKAYPNIAVSANKDCEEHFPIGE